MNADRWQKAKEIYQSAIRQKPQQREAYLAQACAGDDLLRKEVESLLACRSEAEDLMASPALEVAARELAGEQSREPEADLTGRTLLHYRLKEKIGEGGMGAVYRASDTRLDRMVAIKVLRPEFAADPDRRARFAREAQVISKLAHPHICTLFDVGREIETDFLVMEYLEGETLAARLARVAARTPPAESATPVTPHTAGAPAPGPGRRGRPLPLDETLRIGIELAEALAAAHKAGIIHRDLKPGNVMLTSSGVKVLDFGLAKLRGAGEATGRSSVATATTDPLTDAGTRLGTIPYMAPEQVEGKDADTSSDIFALGTILYEMATGRRAFEGDTAASVAAAILEREPEPVTALQPLTPPAFEHVVATCLAKDPEARWQAAGDVSRQLRWIADESRLGRTPSGGLPDAAAAVALAVARRRRRRRLVLGLIAVIVVVAIASVALTWLITGRRVAPTRVVSHWMLDTRPADGLLGAVTANWGSTVSLNRPSRTVIALTPNGRRLAFVGRQGGKNQLYVRDIGAAEAHSIPHTEGADMPFLSPDGQWVGFRAAGALKKVRLDGGDLPVEICKSFRPNGASWGDDGTIVFAPRDTAGLSRVSSNGGEPEIVTTLASGELSHRLPHVLPGAKAVVFTVVERLYDWETARVVVHEFGTKVWKEVVRGAGDARFLPTGHLIYMRRGQMNAARFDLASLKTAGSEVGLVADVMHATNGINAGPDFGAAQVTVSASGTLAYVAGGEMPEEQMRLVWVDRRGQVEPLAVAPKPYRTPRISPDGSRVAVNTVQSIRGIWVHDLRKPQSLTLVTEPGLQAGSPVWTLDDPPRLTFPGTRGGRDGLFWTLADGSQWAEPLGLLEGKTFYAASWTRDGQLLFLTFSPKGLYDIWLLTRDAGSWSGRALIQTQAAEWDAQVSPDGKWLAYSVGAVPKEQVYVASFPSLANRQQVSPDGGSLPVWARDGRELFYVRGRQTPAAELVVHDVAPDGAIALVAKPLFRLVPIRVVAMVPVPSYDVTLDGRRFLFVQESDTPPPPSPNQIHIIENWFEELKAKVPRK